MELLKCIAYLAALSLSGFFIGLFLPRDAFSADSPSYRPLPFEKNGKFYESLRIRRWKDKLPDMSQLFPKILPIKRLWDALGPTGRLSERLPQLIQETCLAEFIHRTLSLAGFVCVGIWHGVGGFAISVAYAVGNLPFVMIQRYNRPRLIELRDRYATFDAPPELQPTDPCGV